ncbi:hypothetical protein B566_EDAN009517 [Ephemera danica]|nr:hypothetical protein B566_EDAN009517 [Ephemera danica]
MLSNCASSVVYNDKSLIVFHLFVRASGASMQGASLLTRTDFISAAYCNQFGLPSSSAADTAELVHLKKRNTMSSKRKSPPTKLHEGNTITTATDYSGGRTKSGSASPPPVRENGTGSSSEPADEVQDFDESSNLSGDDDEGTHHLLASSSYGDDTTVLGTTPGAVKYSDESEEGGYQDEEDLDDMEDLEDLDEIDEDETHDDQHRSPPNKKQRRDPVTSAATISLVPSLVPALSAIHLQRELQQQQQREQEEAHHKSLNNNSSSLNHNSLLAAAPKRTMDDVLKRLTSKMNHSTIKEERPAPSTTPISKQSSGRTSGGALQDSSDLTVDSAASLQHALSGETFLEKERRLSEMILQLQMVRDQLLAQQEQQSKP